MSELAESAQAQGLHDNCRAPIRRMTLADGLILIAAIAIGLGMARIAQSGYPGPTSPAGDLPFDAQVYSSLCWSGLVLMIAVAPLPCCRRATDAADQTAAGIHRFGDLGFLSRQYGYLFCRCWARPAAAMGSDRLPVFHGLAVDWPTILFGWFILAVSGRWQAERSWIDRFGRVLAIGWIIAYIMVSWRAVVTERPACLLRKGLSGRVSYALPRGEGPPLGQLGGGR